MRQWWHSIRTGEEIQPIPWIGPDAIKFLESIVEPDMRCLEHGSGGSTLWLAARTVSVVSYEDDPDWFERVHSRLPDNAKVIMWSKPKPPKLQGRFDLLFIDGEPVGDRKNWIKAAPKLINPGGWIVLDNANRPEYAKEREWLHKQFNCVTIDCNDATQFMVTDFYKAA